MNIHLSSLRHGDSSSCARKRVLIDASTITMSEDGLAVYIVSLIRHLADLPNVDLEFTVLLNPGVHRPDLDQAISAGGMQDLRARIAPIGPKRDWDMFRFLRKHRGRFDLIHVTSNNYPFALKGGVATIHDVTFKHWFHRQAGVPGSAWLARLYLDRVTRHCLKHADAIIAVSESTRRELGLHFDATTAECAKIKVIHEGWEHLVNPDERAQPVLAPRSNGYLFSLGSHRVHKNLAGLLEGFRLALPRIPAGKRLVIGGTSGQKASAYRLLVDEINSKSERVGFTGYLPTAEVRNHYRHADAFIFPSLSEGFGLPVLEAFYYGTPLLCSRDTALPEVAGDAAFYFDPADPSSIANAIVRFYADPADAGRLRALGTERLGKFSWRHAAEQTLAVYRCCLGVPG